MKLLSSPSNFLQAINNYPWFRESSHSLNRIGVDTDIWRVIIIAALFGALYGLLVQPFWASEAVEFGQALAGLVDYEKSAWGATMFADPSLQITVPALLLLAGFHFWTVSVAATTFFCATSFSAVAAAGFVFTRNILISIAIPLLLLGYNFVNSHGYTVLYPVASSQFGQTGQYFTLLALSLLACGAPIAAGIVGGLLSGVHAVWCVCFAVAALPITWWLQPRAFKRLLLSFVLTAITALALLHYGNTLMPPKPQYQAPPVPQQVVTKAAATSAPAVQPNKRIRPLSHNVLFSDAPSPFWAASTFFLPTVIFLLLSFSLYCLQGTNTSRSDNTFISAQRLLAMVAVAVVLITVYKIVEECDPHFYSLSLLDPRLPGLVLRAIFNRWLNLTTLLLPIMTISLLVAFTHYKKTWLAAAVILMALLIKAKSHWGIIPVPQADNVMLLPNAFMAPVSILDINSIVQSVFKVLLFIAVAILAKYMSNDKNNFDNKQLPVVMLGFLVFLTYNVLHFAHVAYVNLVNHRFTGADAYEVIVTAAKMDKGPMIISPGVLGVFYPQLRTGRSMIVPSPLDVYDKAKHQNIHVFCNTDPMLPLPKFYDQVKPCFEKRSARVWHVIEKETTATGLITPESWHLKIRPIVSGGGISYYRIG